MRRLGKTPLTILCVMAAVLIFGQSISCLAEQANLLPCAHRCDHPHEAASTGEAGGACDAACHSSFVLTPASAPAGILAVVTILQPTRESAPDAPVREIEHPPQLS